MLLSKFFKSILYLTFEIFLNYIMFNKLVKKIVFIYLYLSKQIKLVND